MQHHADVQIYTLDHSVTFTSSLSNPLAKSEILQLVHRCTLITGNHFTHTSTLPTFTEEPQI